MIYALRTKHTRMAACIIITASRLAAITGPTPFSGMLSSNSRWTAKTNRRHFRRPINSGATSANTRMISCDAVGIHSPVPGGVYIRRRSPNRAPAVVKKIVCNQTVRPARNFTKNRLRPLALEHERPATNARSFHQLRSIGAVSP